jgi:uncharacterized membrane protein
MVWLRSRWTAAEMPTGRIEAFSDGVFAVAITLLVLDLHVPPAASVRTGSALLQALGHQWPSYLAYISSFIVVLIMWINHHTIFRCVERADHGLLLLNGLLLMSVTLVPFVTSLVSAYVRHPGQSAAVGVYSAVFLVIAILFNLLWRYVAHGGRLLSKDVSPEFVRVFSRQYRFGPLFYLIALALALVNALASLIFFLLLALFFALPTPVDVQAPHSRIDTV